MNGLNEKVYVYNAPSMYMDKEEDHWAGFWELHTEEFLAGYCFAEDTIWYDYYYADNVVTQHHSQETGLVYTWEEEE